MSLWKWIKGEPYVTVRYRSSAGDRSSRYYARMYRLGFRLGETYGFGSTPENARNDVLRSRQEEVAAKAVNKKTPRHFYLSEQVNDAPEQNKNLVEIDRLMNEIIESHKSQPAKKVQND